MALHDKVRKAIKGDEKAFQELIQGEKKNTL